jgi:hypothetical protein
LRAISRTLVRDQTVFLPIRYLSQFFWHQKNWRFFS